MKKILITRPLHSGEKIAQKLIHLGFQPILLPLSRMLPLDTLPKETSHVQVIAATSANAIEFAPETLLENFTGKDFYAVGKTTALMAKKSGFSKIFSGKRDATALAALIQERLPQHTHIGYLCGRTRRSNFEKILKEAGHKIEIIETYKTLTINYTDSAFLSTIDKSCPEGILIYSTVAALTLRSLLERSLLKKILQRASFFCMSQRIANTLSFCKNNKIYIAERPEENSLLSLLLQNFEK